MSFCEKAEQLKARVKLKALVGMFRTRATAGLLGVSVGDVEKCPLRT